MIASYLINWGRSPLLEWLTWFTMQSKQFNQSDIASDITAMTLTFSVNGPQGIVIGDSAWGSIAGVRTCAWDSRKSCRLEPLDLRPNSLYKRPLCFGRIQISRLLVYRFWKRCIEYELFNKFSYKFNEFKVCLHVTYFSRPGPRGGACSGGSGPRGVPAPVGSGPGGCLVETPRKATAAGGTHPTGMHSC